MEKKSMHSTEIDEEAKKIFIGDGEDQELLDFLVKKLENIYDILTLSQEISVEDVENLSADFNAELNEKLANFTVEQGLAIAKEFSKRAQVEFFARMSAEQRAETKSGKGPFLKWIFIYQNIIVILAPSPCSDCGEKCGGQDHNQHRCGGECGGKCREKCSHEKDKS
jgi:hypothetical protein